MWLPDLLYKALPFIYVLAGVLAVFHGQNLPGRGSGVLLVFTAILVWKLRKQRGA